MVEDAARENIRYMEVRYCPRLSTREGLTMAEVLEAEWRGLRRGWEDFGVRTGMINCALRNQDPALSLEVAEALGRLPGPRGGGFRPGRRRSRAPARHPRRRPSTLPPRGCLGITVHAGEAAGPASIAEAIHRCHADRIGHGTRLGEDPALRDYVRDRQIPIEINITSNVQTRVVARAADHPVRDFYDRGLAVHLNTDSWLMSGVSLTDEYWLAHTALGFTRAEIDRMLLNAFEAAFLPWPEKRALVGRVRDELAGL